jgi:uncharacterized protein
MSQSQNRSNEVRYQSIDTVRGFAVLGILLMNIVGMGLPSFSYLDPTYAGGSHGADLWTWAVNNVLTDGKMRGLFTILFGASTVLIAQRAEGGRPSALQTHYRRMFWLFVIGMIHAYLFWWGDILVCYALSGLFLFPVRKLDPKFLIALGTLILVILFAYNAIDAQHLYTLRAAATAPGASATAIKAWQDASATVVLPPEMKAQELAGFGGGFMDALQARARMALFLQLMLNPTDYMPEAVGNMLIGMGLFRLGYFTLGWSNRAYLATIAFGYLVCVPLTAWLAYLTWKSNFDPLVIHQIGGWQQGTRPFIALAHGSVLLLIVRAGALRWLMERLSAAGRMAFSNYLLTSIITTFVFCGFGFGLYGKLSRFELLYVVVGVWAFILLWSAPWLARFHYGPFEWVWRSLVRWETQPFVKRGVKAAGATA